MKGRCTGFVAVAAALAVLSAAPAAADWRKGIEGVDLDMSKGLPGLSELTEGILGVLAHQVQEHDGTDEHQVKKMLSEPGVVERNLGMMSFDMGSLESMYEEISAEYCADPSYSDADVPSFEFAPATPLSATWSGPELIIEVSTGSCQSVENKTYECTRPSMSITKNPPSFGWGKGAKAVAWSKPGGSFSDKSCAFGGKTFGSGETASLYDGGSETYDFSGFSAMKYAAVDAFKAPLTAAFSGRSMASVNSLMGSLVDAEKAKSK